MTMTMTVKLPMPLALSLLGWLVLTPSAGAEAQTTVPTESGMQVWLGDMLAVSYQARIEGDWLVVEATHEEGWHTYSMDNESRAREATGKERPETELPTIITPLEGVTVLGEWRQTPPLDLSTPEILWYTWGFEGTSYFAARIGEAATPAMVQVDAQACTKDLCAMVDALPVPVKPADAGESVDPESLVPVPDDTP